MNMKKLSEGAEAHIYSINFLGFDGILKRRIKKSYRIRDIDDNLRLERTKSEARIMGFVSSFGINSPNVLLVSKYDIIMNRIYGKNLNDILNSNSKRDNLQKIFAILGHYAALLHNNNIIHGDYTPANVIIDANGAAYLIDFGLSDTTNSIEDKALDLLLMKRSVEKDDFRKFIDIYSKNSRDSKSIIKRLGEIEKRGRYNTRTLLIN